MALEREEKFQLANIIQVPSYVSLMSALSYYEMTTQVQREFIESIALKRTKAVTVEQTVFNFTKINKLLFFDFARKRGFFIASPEKAFLDAMYLMSLGRYSMDLSSIDFDKFDFLKVRQLILAFPEKTQIFIKANGYFQET
ncbi:hypothetical protein JW935_29400 [candidate division KSB1 bacterium]|nr:hypothetical protein [candidate division KSB1 bacterium]